MSKAFLGWLQKGALVALALSFLSGIWPSSVAHLSDVYRDEPLSRSKPRPATVLDGLFNRAHAFQLKAATATNWLPERPGSALTLILISEAARLDARHSRTIIRIGALSWRYVPAPAPPPYKTGPPAV